MKFKPSFHATQWLLAAGLLLGMASAHAAGYTIRHQQEQLVTAGMTGVEVRQLIGSPITRVKYGNEPGPTWTYNVAEIGSAFPDRHVVFDVTFGANGRVVTASERMEAESSAD